MPLVQDTFNCAAGAGYTIPLQDLAGNQARVGFLQILTRGELYIQATSDASAAAPTATPAPAAGARARFVHLLTNESVTFDLLEGLFASDRQAYDTKIAAVRVWAVGGGDLILTGN